MLPSILIDTEAVAVEGGNLVVATVHEGMNKPYHDSKGIVWVKQSSDKRRVFDNSVLAEMMSQCGTSMPRNEFLFTNANYLLPYTGAGTGVIRAMEGNPM